MNVDDIKFEIKQYLNKIEDLSNFCKLNKENYLFCKKNKESISKHLLRILFTYTITLIKKIIKLMINGNTRVY
jgi:hypothetical protein